MPATGSMVVGGQSIPVVAEAALSKYMVVSAGTAQNGVVVGTAASTVRGVIDQDYDSGENVAAQINGTCRLIAHDNAIRIGHWLKPVALGRVDGTVTDKDVVMARALEDVAAAGDVFAAELVTFTLST